MKRIFILLAVFLISCASVVNYPITLSYSPTKALTKENGGTVAVALLRDKRTVADKRLIGAKDNKIPFLSLIGEPSGAVSGAFAAYLEDRGFHVQRIGEVWDGSAGTIRPEWNGLVIGGNLEDFTMTAKTVSLVKTEYTCSIKFFLTFADAKTKEIRHRERTEVSTSYVTVDFSREKAEQLINSVLAEAVEKALANTGSYFAK